MRKLSVFMFVVSVIIISFVFKTGAMDNNEWKKRLPEDTIEYKFDEETGVVTLRGEGGIYWSYFGDYYATEEDEGYDGDDYNEMFDYEICHKNYKIKTVIIEEGITHIANYVFSGLINLETVILPEGIEEIDYGTFNRCEKLKNVILPEGIETIEAYAFAGCKELKYIGFPSSLKNIKECAFKGSGLENIYISENIECLGYDAFTNCDNLKKIVFTNATCTMWHCDTLEEIVYPEDYTDGLGIIAAGCENLKKITFPCCKKINNVKISKDSYSKFIVNCPEVNIGYVNLDVVKDGKAKYAVVTPLNKNVDNISSFKYTQKGPTGKLSWSNVEGAGYYQLYYKNNGKWQRIYSGINTSVNCCQSGEYKVRAVSYDGKTHIYGEFAKATVNYLRYVGSLKLKDSTLKWKKHDNVTGYIVYYCTEKDGAYKKLTSTSENKVDVSLLEGVYSFRVRSYYKSKSGTIYSQYSYKTV